MKRNSEDSYSKDMQSKRYNSAGMSGQHYMSQSQNQQSNQVISPYQFLPYPGNMMYSRPPHWSQQSNRYGHHTNLPPPPATPPPAQPPPPPMNSSNQMKTPIFDLTQPPPPIRQNISGGNNSNSSPSTSSGLGQSRMNSSMVRPSLRGRSSNYRGAQMRQRSMFNLRNNTSNNSRQSNYMDGNVEDQDGGKRVLVNRKSKRKPMSARYMRSKEWEREDAEKALELENEYNKMQRTPMLILKFPDPELNKHIVKKYSSAIETVHFQQPSTPRYCFVTLKDGTDLEKVRKELCEIPFGTGKIIAEQKFSSNEESQPVSPEEIDPYTLYIGNLPTKVCVKTVKEHFPGAARIDIGYAQRMKYTRYAFIRYNNVEDAMEAYKRTFNTLIGNRSLIVRFRRSKGNIGLPGESRVPNAPKKVQDAIKEGENNVKEKIKVSQSILDSKDLQKKSISKDIDIEVPLLVNSDDFEDDEDEEEEDSKENVMEESRKLRLQMMQNSRNNERNVVIKQEDENEDYEFEVRKQYGINDSASDTTSLLGTRIKEEPMDDDELLACARTYNMDDDYGDEEPEEEEDYHESRSVSTTFGPHLKLEGNSAKRYHDDGFKTPQLYDKPDIKPDFSTLPPIPYTTSGYGFSHNRYEYPRDRTNSFRSSMQQPNNRKNERINKPNDKDDDEEDDIFDDLNAEDEFDGIGEF